MTENEKNKQRNDLISVVAHDLKTPIASVRGFIDLIQVTGPLTERQTHFVSRALMGLDRMEALVTGLLDITRLERGDALEMGPCDLKVMVDEAVELLEDAAAARDITIHADVPDNLMPIQGDYRLLMQVINNLIGNAIKYNLEGGDVWIGVEEFADEQAVRLTVRDTGIGISEAELGRVFEEFFRSRQTKEMQIEGSGLGLSIVKRIVESHGGTISVESVHEEGTTFTIQLPHKRLTGQ